MNHLRTRSAVREREGRLAHHAIVIRKAHVIELHFTETDVVRFARGTYKLRNPNAHPYKTIDNALKDAIARSKPVANAAKIIPWYQDFTLGPPRYGVTEIRAQKKAGYDNGFQSWILWNPKSNYTLAALEPQS